MKNLNANVFTRWANNNFGSRKGNQKAARAIQPEPISETSLSELWGIVPVYTGKVVRRRGDQLILVAIA